MRLGKSFAVEWVGFARANSVSPGYVKTEITDFVPEETQKLWNDKIPMGYVNFLFSPLPSYSFLSENEICFSPTSMCFRCAVYTPVRLERRVCVSFVCAALS